MVGVSVLLVGHSSVQCGGSGAGLEVNIPQIGLYPLVRLAPERVGCIELAVDLGAVLVRP